MNFSYKIEHLFQRELADKVFYPEFTLPESIQFIGNANLLFHTDVGTWALFCSSRCPGSIILKSYDLAQKWAKENVTLISGFHSAVEKEMLQVFLDSKANVVVCPARSLVNMRIPVQWRKPIEQGRLLLVSPFEDKYKRPTAELSRQRNLFAAALADKVLFLHATPGGKLEAFVAEISKWNKPIYFFDDPSNYHLRNMGILYYT